MASPPPTWVHLPEPPSSANGSDEEEEPVKAVLRKAKKRALNLEINGQPVKKPRLDGGEKTSQSASNGPRSGIFADQPESSNSVSNRAKKASGLAPPGGRLSSASAAEAVSAVNKASSSGPAITKRVQRSREERRKRISRSSSSDAVRTGSVKSKQKSGVHSVAAGSKDDAIVIDSSDSDKDRNETEEMLQPVAGRIPGAGPARLLRPPSATAPLPRSNPKDGEALHRGRKSNAPGREVIVLTDSDDGVIRPPLRASTPPNQRPAPDSNANPIHVSPLSDTYVAGRGKNVARSVEMDHENDMVFQPSKTPSNFPDPASASISSPASTSKASFVSKTLASSSSQPQRPRPSLPTAKRNVKPSSNPGPEARLPDKTIQNDAETKKTEPTIISSDSEPERVPVAESAHQQPPTSVSSKSSAPPSLTNIPPTVSKAAAFPSLPESPHKGKGGKETPNQPSFSLSPGSRAKSSSQTVRSRDRTRNSSESESVSQWVQSFEDVFNSVADANYKASPTQLTEFAATTTKLASGSSSLSLPHTSSALSVETSSAQGRKTGDADSGKIKTRDSSLPHRQHRQKLSSSPADGETDSGSFPIPGSRAYELLYKIPSSPRVSLGSKNPLVQKPKPKKADSPYVKPRSASSSGSTPSGQRGEKDRSISALMNDGVPFRELMTSLIQDGDGSYDNVADEKKDREAIKNREKEEGRERFPSLPRSLVRSTKVSDKTAQAQGDVPKEERAPQATQVQIQELNKSLEAMEMTNIVGTVEKAGVEVKTDVKMQGVNGTEGPKKHAADRWDPEDDPTILPELDYVDSDEEEVVEQAMNVDATGADIAVGGDAATSSSGQDEGMQMQLDGVSGHENGNDTGKSDSGSDSETHVQHMVIVEDEPESPLLPKTVSSNEPMAEVPVTEMELAGRSIDSRSSSSEDTSELALRRSGRRSGRLSRRASSMSSGADSYELLGNYNSSASNTPPRTASPEFFSKFSELGGFPVVTWAQTRKWLRHQPPSHKFSKDLRHELQDYINSYNPEMRKLPQMTFVFETMVYENTCENEPDAPPIKILNEVDDLESTPPWEFYYTNDMWLGKGVSPPSRKNLVGCDCEGKCTKKTCKCWKRQEEQTKSYEIQGFMYDQNGLLKRPGTLPVFECNSLCNCGEECRNRVVSQGRKCKIMIKKTKKKGWGVFACERIPKGTFIGIYSGELLGPEEAEERGLKYDEFGRTYLFDIDFWYMKDDVEKQTSENSQNRTIAYSDKKKNNDSQSDSDSEEEAHRQTKYTVDAYHAGNFTRFLNHSCDPNASLTPVYVDEDDIERPLLTVFSKREIQNQEEITFSYSGDPDEDEDEPLPQSQLSPKRGRRGNDTKHKLLDTPKGSASVHVPCQCGAANCKGKLWRT